MKKTIVDLTYYSFHQQDSKSILNSCYSTYGFLEEISKNFNTFFVARTPHVFEPISYNSVTAFFHKGKSLKKWVVPFRFHSFIKSLNPDFILVHGFGSAHYLIFLKLLCWNSKIVLQCNGFAPKPRGLKKVVYKVADVFIDGYLFTGIENASSWYESGTISRTKVYEVMEGSTNFKFDKKQIRKEKSYLWVGNLLPLKDPITVLKAFDAFLATEPNATLTMVYVKADLYDEVFTIISKSKLLKEAVNLLGFIPHDELEKLYNQHQFFISASHQEGSGYALVESMACGCIPIITNIPSHNYMAANGFCGFLFNPKNNQELLNQLIYSSQIDLLTMQEKVLKQFKDKLSFEAIAKRIEEIFHSL